MSPHRGGSAASKQLFDRASELMPGAVNSPVRAFGSVGGRPFFVDHAHGSRICDVDGNEYIDYVLSWGALMLGHAHPALTHAVRDAADRGTSFGAPSGAEVELAELVSALVPSVEMLRLVNSGTEATMSAVRLARGVTGRDLLVKFDGCYHGHGDSFLVQAGSGVATLGLPDSPGVPEDLARLTLTAPFNDEAAVAELFEQHGERIAAVIVEPVMGNAGVIRPVDGFLEVLRRLTAEHGALLIFDEVMTGFRVAAGGAQERFGVEPDLTTLGKVLGGGLPIGAFGGSRELMENIAPTGPIYQAGTLSGNPLATAAGVSQLLFLREGDPYDELEAKGQTLVDGIVSAAGRRGIPASGEALGGMWGVHFVEAPVRNFADAKKVDRDLFSRFFHACLKRGVFVAPSPFEAGFVSTAHSDDDIGRTLEVLDDALEQAVSG